MRTRTTGVFFGIAAAVAVTACSGTSKQASAKGENLAPIAKAGRAYRQDPRFKTVKVDKKSGMPVAIPTKEQEAFKEERRRLSQIPLKDAARAYRAHCRRFGNYRYPMREAEGRSMMANSFIVVWESTYWALAGRYRKEGMPKKAIPLEREITERGSSWNLPFHLARDAQKGRHLEGALEIPPGPHGPEDTIYATVSLRNENDLPVRTHLELRTVRGFDKAYSREQGKWVKIAHPGSHLSATPDYDLLIPAKGKWNKRILVIGQSVEHVGSYEVRIVTDCIECKANTAVLHYSKSEEGQ